MKGKDFFLKLKEQGKIENPDYDGFIEKLPDFDVPDTGFKAFEESFLTIDKAKADSRVYQHYKAQVLDGVDQWINEGVKNQMWASSILDERDTFKRLKMVKEDINSSIERLKLKPGGDPEKEKTITNQAATIEELSKKVSSVNEENLALKERYDKELKEKIEAVNMDYALNSSLDGYTFADEHTKTPEDKRAIKEFILHKVKTGDHLLKLNDGQILVRDKNNPTSPKFDGNSEIVFKNMLDKLVEPHLKKNNAAPPTHTPGIRQAQPITEKATLRELRAQGATTSVNGTI